MQVLLLKHRRILARNQRITVLNLALCDLAYAALGLCVSYSTRLYLVID